ncbi:membrane protein insertase YidC, partial [Streptomyces sp. NPDC002262]
AEAEGAAAPKRQQPKRQTKAQRQSGGPQAKSDETVTETAEESAGETAQDAGAKTSLEKKPETPAKSGTQGGGRSRANSGGSRQRKGQQRPKHPSSKK